MLSSLVAVLSAGAGGGGSTLGLGLFRREKDTKCYTLIYLCLCGSHLESQQEGKGEIRYNIRQHSVCLQSLGNLVTMNFFKVYWNQLGLSGMFECHTLGLGI
jgi:hypothetical protein